MEPEEVKNPYIIQAHPPCGGATVNRPRVRWVDTLILPRLPIRLQPLFMTISFPCHSSGRIGVYSLQLPSRHMH
jgi:hypothetical protein